MKYWLHSKTLWFNTLWIVASVLDLIVQNATQIGIPPALLTILSAIVVPSINLVLRAVTTQPLTFSPGPPTASPSQGVTTAIQQHLDGENQQP